MSGMYKKQKPLLSICIPTYNRDSILEQCIESIVNQVGFDERVEIVISDNCSTDFTKDVVEKFQQKHANVIYHRNIENIVDKNYVMVLSKGKGRYLKLLNDYSIMRPGSLEKMIQTIEKYNSQDYVIHFSNGVVVGNNSIIQCDNFDSFVSNISYYSTWINNFGIWYDDFHALTDIDRYVHLQLFQTDILFRSINVLQKRSIVINNEVFFDILIKRKTVIGYNFYAVFIENYFFILGEYIQVGVLSKTVFNKEKNKLLFKYVLPWTAAFYISKTCQIDVPFKQAIGIIRNYVGFITFYFFYLGLGFYWILYKLNLIDLAKKIRKRLFREYN